MPTLFMPYDQSLEKYNLPVRQKIEIPIYESRLSNYFFRLLSFHQFVFPDSKVSFSWSWRKVVKKIKTKPQVIYSRSNPISSALMALKLKKYFGCKWILHFSDPWSLSPLHALNQKTIDQEKEFFEVADLITFTSVKTLALYSAEYPQLIYKFQVLPNVYDPEDINDYTFEPRDKLRIVYTGGMARERDAFFLNHVLEAVNRISPDSISQLDFVFAGDRDSKNRQFFETTPWNCIKHLGLLSYSEIKPLQQSAHVLLVIDNPTSTEQAIYFPSKILDYFIARKLIWAVTPKGSTTRAVLGEQKHVSFDHTEYEVMATFLIDCIEKLRVGNSEYFNADAVPDLYNAEVNADQLADLIRRVVD